MNLDLKNAYENAVKLANTHADISIDLLKDFSALVMKNTGQEYKTALGAFSSARGELRLLNVTTGIGGKSYMNYSKVPAKLSEFCVWLNKERENYTHKSTVQLYEISCPLSFGHNTPLGGRERQNGPIADEYAAI